MFVDRTVMFSGDGSKWYPFKTLGEALAKAKVDDTIFVTPPTITNDCDSPIIMDKDGMHICGHGLKWRVKHEFKSNQAP